MSWNKTVSEFCLLRVFSPENKDIQGLERMLNSTLLDLGWPVLGRIGIPSGRW